MEKLQGKRPGQLGAQSQSRRQGLNVEFCAVAGGLDDIPQPQKQGNGPFRRHLAAFLGDAGGFAAVFALQRCGKKLRQAMSLAIDRQLLVDTLWEGYASIPNGYNYEEFGQYYVKDYPTYKLL